MTVFEFCIKAYKVKELELTVCFHFNRTDSERTQTFHTNGDKFLSEIEWDTQQAQVIMFEPTKRGALKVYAYLEIDD